ncbi:MAG: metallophosphoesterase [Planctomycetes bacterium]|nr:metallophosphoesterase [Planctomycetota bacterium]
MNSRWLRRALWIAGIGCLGLNLLDDPPLATGAYLQDVGQGGATVALITPRAEQLACEVRDATGQLVARAAEPSGRRRHRLRIDGLQPAQKYSYAVVDAATGANVDAGTLRTAPADDKAPVRFAFLGDSGGQPWWVWMQRTPLLHLPARWGWLPVGGKVSTVGRAVAEYAPDFVLHLGDVVYPRGQQVHYATGFFRPFAAALRQAPFYAVLGNHDTMDADGQQLLANFDLPGAATTGDGRCFSFAWGPVRILGLDCNVDRLGGVYRADHPATEYLAQELGRCSEPWIVVASHFPLRSQSRQRNRGDLLLHLQPTLRENDVSLYLSGHDHCYQRFHGTPADGGPPLVVSGGGGKSLYDVRPDPRFVVESSYHWCSAEVVGAELVLRAHRLDGSLVDTFHVALPEGEALEGLRRRHPARAARIDALRRG